MRWKESLHDEKPLWYEESVREKIIAFVICIICGLIILSSETKGGEVFLSEYWERPIPPQNDFNKFPLYPEECGKCHKEQHNGWKGSLHSRAVGPGLLGQLRTDKDPQFAQSCYFCHAPMAEQSEIILPSPLAGEGQGEGIKNPSFDNKLKLSGVSCSVCHLRKGKVYGPPARKTVSSKKQDNHNGFVEKDFFEKADFCEACHQLDEGYELNGKLLVNTYREWKESIYGQNNVTCQNCHMPDRQHLWRGIHDKEMVLRGVRIESVRRDKGARITITNSGVGHYFPTYATPLVVVKGFMLDKTGKVIQGSLKKAFIGRTISLDLSEEIFDTRIPPQKSFEFDYATRGSYSDGKITFEVWVYPDEFYNKFYKAILKDADMDLNRGEVEKAIETTNASPYRLFREVL
ncbi:MAG: hypothetical protein HZB81_06110 [Deltaproteobacteria bacterium]|nr:hypothetical protein [Deltaproteobacteria bacterium]